MWECLPVVVCHGSWDARTIQGLVPDLCFERACQCDGSDKHSGVFHVWYCLCQKRGRFCGRPWEEQGEILRIAHPLTSFWEWERLWRVCPWHLTTCTYICLFCIPWSGRPVLACCPPPTCNWSPASGSPQSLSRLGRPVEWWPCWGHSMLGRKWGTAAFPPGEVQRLGTAPDIQNGKWCPREKQQSDLLGSVLPAPCGKIPPHWWRKHRPCGVVLLYSPW